MQSHTQLVDRAVLDNSVAPLSETRPEFHYDPLLQTP